MVNVGHNLAPPNLPPGEKLNGINLKKVMGQSKYVYLLPSRQLPDPTIPKEYFVSNFS